MEATRTIRDKSIAGEIILDAISQAIIKNYQRY